MRAHPSSDGVHPVRVLVTGGHGNFGARICRALARDGFEVIAASRDPDAGHLRAGFGDGIQKARINISDPQLAGTLRALSPHTVIHCVGPFQGQGYHVARAALGAGANYIDLADGRAFVAGFAQAMDPDARAAGRLAVSGASTLPALSSAVVDACRDRFVSLDEIRITIAPAQRAPRGAATLRAVFSYLGRPFPWWTDGAWRTAYGWQALRRTRIGGLGRRWAAACDVPDLALFPERYPGVRTVQFRAALEVGIQHLLLAFVAQLRRLGLPVPLERWVSPLDRAATWLNRFGSECGGMAVELVGKRQDGLKSRLEWSLVADDNHGPEIPCMAATLVAGKLLRGDPMPVGAMPCMGLLALDEFVPEWERWGIRTTLEETLL
jgi:saccharopine dehydrogenase-like NADP-dependent oxidoreductase